MTLSDIAKYRLISQQIVNTKFSNAVDLVEWLGAVQAQEYAQTKWGLGLRLPGSVDSDLEQCYTKGQILRTHLLRPTWHFVSAKDIRWLLMLTAPRVNMVNGSMYRKLELDKKLFNRCNDILIKALTGGKQLTREAINEEFKKNKIEAQGHRLSYLMMYAELAGIICSGAREGNLFTYALMQERVPASNTLSNDEALMELSRRYFLSRGPATVKDFSTWSGLTLSDCKRGLEMTKSFWETRNVGGEAYYFSEEITSQQETTPSMSLLPIYDEFIMGYKNRSAIFQFRNSLTPPPPIRYDCMIVCDGQVIGTWKRTLDKRSIDAKLEFFKPLNKAQTHMLDNAISRLAAFAGTPVHLQL